VINIIPSAVIFLHRPGQTQLTGFQTRPQEPTAQNRHLARLVQVFWILLRQALAHRRQIPHCRQQHIRAGWGTAPLLFHRGNPRLLRDEVGVLLKVTQPQHIALDPGPLQNQRLGAGVQVETLPSLQARLRFDEPGMPFIVSLAQDSQLSLGLPQLVRPRGRRHDIGGRHGQHRQQCAQAPGTHLASAAPVAPPVVSRSISAALIRPWALDFPVNLRHSLSIMM
jgi:hypothetical protein